MGVPFFGVAVLCFAKETTRIATALRRPVNGSPKDTEAILGRPSPTVKGTDPYGCGQNQWYHFGW